MNALKKKKQADFKRQKKKAGKKLVRDNVTKTAFKSTTLQMSAQSVAEDKGEVVSQRNLTLKELLGQVRHHSHNVRKDALLGLLELFTSFPGVLLRHLREITERIIGAITDPETHVRRALLTLMRGMLNGDVMQPPAVLHVALRPFLPLLLTYTRSALSHVDEGIRLDGLGLLGLWCTYVPEAVSSTAAELLPNFVSFLSTATGTGNRSLTANPRGRMASAQNRLDTLTSLRSVLGCAKLTDTPTTSTAASVVSVPYTQGVCLIPVIEPSAAASPASFWDTKPRAGLATTPTGQVDASRVAADLLPVLIELWIEANALEPLTPASAPLIEALAHTMGDLAKVAAGQAADGGAAFFRGSAVLMRRHVVACFPLRAHETQPKLAGAAVAANVALCHLLSHYVHLESETRGSDLNAYIERILSGELSTQGVDAAILADQLLPLVGRLASHASDAKPTFEALVVFCNRVPVLSTLKRAAVEQLCWLVMNPYVRLPTDAVTNWILGLPKLLFQLKAAQPDTTKAILSFLRDYCRSPKREASRINLAQLQASLVPFFFTEMKRDNAVKGIFGPFTRLPPALQLIALDTLYPTQPFGEPMFKALAACCNSLKLTADIVHRITEMVHLTCWTGALEEPQPAELSFLLTLADGDARRTVEEEAAPKKRKADEAALDQPEEGAGAGANADSALKPYAMTADEVADIAAGWLRHSGPLARQALYALIIDKMVEARSAPYGMTALLAACQPDAESAHITDHVPLLVEAVLHAHEQGALASKALPAIEILLSSEVLLNATLVCVVERVSKASTSNALVTTVTGLIGLFTHLRITSTQTALRAHGAKLQELLNVAQTKCTTFPVASHTVETLHELLRAFV